MIQLRTQLSSFVVSEIYLGYEVFRLLSLEDDMKTEGQEESAERHFDYFAEDRFVSESPAPQPEVDAPQELRRAWAGNSADIEA